MGLETVLLSLSGLLGVQGYVVPAGVGLGEEDDEDQNCWRTLGWW